jgi:hypothetical protein
MKSARLSPGTLITALLLLYLFSAGAGSAQATTTHAYIHTITLPGFADPQPEAVDNEGNLIVWLPQQREIAKFDTNGNPVNFSGLGTNVIDGKGGHECPAVPSDCDRISTNGFRNGTGGYINDVYRALDVDHSGGPANGYIYVSNDFHSAFAMEENDGEVDVFAPSGVYLGTIDEQPTPDGYGDRASTLAVDPHGVLYISHFEAHQGSHVDRYVPIDGNPAHDQFAGQLRQTKSNAGAYEGVAPGLTYVYTIGRDETHTVVGSQTSYDVDYSRFPQSEFHRQGLFNSSISETFPPFIGPFGARGNNRWGPCNCFLPVIYVDPLNENAFVGGGYGAGMAEFNPQNQQVGPAFGTEQIESARAMVIDRSGGPHEGDIYIHGESPDGIAVFGPPAVIPDIEGLTAEGRHTTAHISANINLGGGPNAVECKIQYGPRPQSFGAGGFSDYESVTPCAPPAPYSENQEIHADLSGLQPEVNYHYRVVVKSENGTNETEDQTVPTHAVLSVRTDPETDLTKNSADLNGSLDPDGIETEYRFDYGISTRYGSQTPFVNAGSGTGVESVAPVDIGGLQSGRVYHYRIVARNSLGKTKGLDRTFTVPARPGISGVRTTNLTDTSADLNARIDSRTYDSRAFFEYGLSPEYGHSTPEEDIGSEAEPVVLLAHIEGLEPGRTIHYRVVAVNEWGTTRTADTTFNFQAPSCPNAHVRQETNASYLPDCRAYELVSPGAAGAVSFFPGSIASLPGFSGGGGGEFDSPAEILDLTSPNALGLAVSPARFGFFGGEGSVIGLHPPNTLADRYVSTRTTHGWVTTYPGTKGNEALLVARPECDASLSECVDSQSSGVALTGHVSPSGKYLWDVDGNPLGRLPTNISIVPNGERFIGEMKPSPDFSHFAFSSRNVAFAAGGLESAPGSAYDNEVANETVKLISKLPNGDPIPQTVPRPDEYIKFPAISNDGSHILMSTESESGARNLYLAIDDAAVIHIGEGIFAGMTSDGTKVAFVSSNRMVPEDTDGSDDMYLWEQSTGEVKILSQGNGQGNSDSCAAFFTERCDVQVLETQRPDLDNAMAEGSGEVYFYSPEQLDPSNPGVANERNLYVYRNGHPQYVTTLDPETEVDRVQVSPDGSHMAFLSRTQATSYSNVSADDGAPGDSQEPTAWEEMYTYEPATGEILCASCDPSGQPPAVATSDEGHEVSTTNKDVKSSMSGRFMTNDGRVAFTTADALVPADTNGKLDVYEFSGNRPQLITSGAGDQDTVGGIGVYPQTHVGFEGFSQDGTDLYFSTFETLVPEDENGTFVKFYDARTNGGFPIRPLQLPCTAADECHGDSTSAPGESSFATSAGLKTGGNLAPPKTGNHRTRRSKQRHAKPKKRHHRHTRRQS